MGSNQTDPRFGGETRHYVRIPRSFAVATKAVTVAQVNRFLSQAEIPEFASESSPEDAPAIGLNWYMAGRYCRWLSEQENIDENQMCFPKVEEIKPGMKLPKNYLQRTGYRLPTEAEWEYACRAGTATDWSHGSAEDMLPSYAWYAGNAKQRVHPVGLKKPNDLGLFDIHGNAWQWCLDRYRSYAIGPRANEDKEDSDVYHERSEHSQNFEAENRVLRGGAFHNDAPSLGLTSRFTVETAARYTSAGLRVARTYR